MPRFHTSTLVVEMKFPMRIKRVSDVGFNELHFAIVVLGYVHRHDFPIWFSHDLNENLWRGCCERHDFTADTWTSNLPFFSSLLVASRRRLFFFVVVVFFSPLFERAKTETGWHLFSFDLLTRVNISSFLFPEKKQSNEKTHTSIYIHLVRRDRMKRERHTHCKTKWGRLAWYHETKQAQR